MSYPYNYHFPQRSETMFMATIQSSHSKHNNSRISSFLKQDIPGSQPKTQIPQTITRENFAHSTFVEAVPSSHLTKNKYIPRNNLRTDDIQYAQPQCNDFKTKRVTNPINPRYHLPYVPAVDPEPARAFIRDTLDISDIKTKKDNLRTSLHQKDTIEGSSPSKLFRTVQAVNRLQVKDINKDGVFVSQRTTKPTNPLEPSYTWRDGRNHLNRQYGDIGARPKIHYPQNLNRRSDLAYSTHDIEGAHANSFNDRRYFMNARRSLKDSLNTSDIPRSHASSLNKGISTNREVNPLMPQYKYPSPGRY